MNIDAALVTAAWEQCVGAVADAMRKLSRALEQSAEAFSGLLRSMVRIEQARYGARNFTAEGAWQSDLCAGWLHSECPLPDHCDCRCHP